MLRIIYIFIIIGYISCYLNPNDLLIDKNYRFRYPSSGAQDQFFAGNGETYDFVPYVDDLAGERWVFARGAADVMCALHVNGSMGVFADIVPIVDHNNWADEIYVDVHPVNGGCCGIVNDTQVLRCVGANAGSFEINDTIWGTETTFNISHNEAFDLSVVQMVGGYESAWGLLSNGSVICIGKGCRTYPVRVPLPAQSGLYSRLYGSGHSLCGARIEDGAIDCWTYGGQARESHILTLFQDKIPENPDTFFAYQYMEAMKPVDENWISKDLNPAATLLLDRSWNDPRFSSVCFGGLTDQWAVLFDNGTLEVGPDEIFSDSTRMKAEALTGNYNGLASLFGGFALVKLGDCSGEPIDARCSGSQGTCNVDTKICECEFGYIGYDCSRQVCDGSCKNEGICTSLVDDFTCDCPIGFGGKDCSVEYCVDTPCLNGENCTAIEGGRTCECPIGFGGKDCSVEYCIDTPCLNGGNCTAIEGGRTCECPIGFGPEDCSIEYCIDTPCLNGGNCTAMEDGRTCECADGYAGEDCSTDYCVETPCLNNGNCSRIEGGRTCECADGYGSQDCSTDYCTINPCQNGGVCIRSNNGKTCDCDENSEGDECQTIKPTTSSSTHKLTILSFIISILVINLY